MTVGVREGYCSGAVVMVETGGRRASKLDQYLLLLGSVVVGMAVLYALYCCRTRIYAGRRML